MPSLDIICDLGLAVCLTASFLLWMRERDHERRIKWLEQFREGEASFRMMRAYWEDKQPRSEMERADREEGFLP